MIIPLTTVRELESLVVDVFVDAGDEGGRSSTPHACSIRSRSHAVEELRAAASALVGGAVDLLESDIVLEWLPSVRARALWRCRWSPSKLRAELWGGDKDGRVIELPSPRPFIEYATLPSNWREAMRDGVTVVPKVYQRFILSGYCIEAGRYVYQLEE